MHNGFTEADLKKLKADGKIAGFTLPKKRYEREKLLKRKGKQYYWIATNFYLWAKENGLIVTPEFKFHPKRKFRFDFAVESEKIALEYEGIISNKSRHTTLTGYTGDTDKYNAAAVDGWIVIRLTAMNYKTLWNQLRSITLKKSK